jgi:hypothetical protein
MEVDGSVTGNSTIRVTSTTGNPVSTILIKGDLASTADYAIVVDGALTAASEIEITGTAATGGFGLGKNLIKICELDGDLLVGTNASAGIGVFGDVIVADSFHSTGRLVAAARNALATFYTDLLDPTTMTYQIIGSDAGHDWEILFGFNELWA